jgi:hypothetical protein
MEYVCVRILTCWLLKWGGGGYENLVFGEKDCRNFIENVRNLQLGKRGAEALRDYFNKMQKQNDGFFM